MSENELKVGCSGGFEEVEAEDGGDRCWESFDWSPVVGVEYAPGFDVREALPA